MTADRERLTAEIAKVGAEVRNSSGKSSPATATRRTRTYCDAARAKYTAEPPSTFSTCPCGDETVSIPTLPVTKSDIKQTRAITIPEHLNESYTRGI
ncbi:MAG: hypothetical protein IIB57_14105 [Planctomycetes bacterium]|nr:hypothetical protein [Planctomycetota bacterium]